MKIVVCLLLPIVYCLLPTAFSQTWYAIPDGKGGYGVHGAAYSLKTINGELYVGGAFEYMWNGNGPGNGIAKYNGSVWDSLGPGVYGAVGAIEFYNGEIYAAGNFSGAYSGLPWPNNGVNGSEHIARWDGTTWKALGTTGANSGIFVMKYNNDLYIGGDASFQSIGGVSCMRIVRWNGNTFDNMQGGMDGPFFPEVYAMEVYKGQLYVGGSFTKAGSISANYIARWDGSKWDSVGTGMDWGGVKAFAVDTVNDILYVGGWFTQAGGIPVKSVAKWDGTNWSAVAPCPILGGLQCMKFFKGELYAGSYGNFSPGDTVLLRYDGNQWHPVYGPNWSVITLEIYKGNLYVGGGFDKIDTTTVNGIACYGDSCPGTPITLTLPYGVNEVNKPAFKFKVYPNPAKKEINIELAEGSKQLAGKEKYMVRVKNSLGQEITQRVIPSPANGGINSARNLTIDTSQFPKGLLLVEVCTPSLSGRDGVGLCHTEKVVIE